MFGTAAGATEVLSDRIRTGGDRPAVTFVSDDGDLSLSYAELGRRARGVASRLRRDGAAGDRVLLLFPPGLEFATALAGCLFAGMVAVPAPLPDRRGRIERTRAIAKDADIAFILTDSGSLAEVAGWAGRDLPGVRTLATDRAGDADRTGDDGNFEPEPVDPSALAILQYTSGSTSDPKGVEISHGNLLHNTEALARAYRLDGDSVLGGWVPVYHDMGLMGHLVFALLLGASSVLMGQVAFLKRPHRWLELISRFGVTFSAAPNFAFELCTRRITDDQLAGIDLSRWRTAVNGSEPVRAPVLAAFARRFAGAGFRIETLAPSYGMAEATVFVSGTDGRAPLVRRAEPAALERLEFVPAAPGEAARELVSCGPLAHGFEARIVDPDSLAARPDGGIGEIWLRGASISAGYWRNAAATSAVRTGDGWLRTGDLGLLLEGELYVTGRIKETLVFRGRNIYPQDIEYEVRRHHPALGAGVGAAFAVPGESGDELVVTHEVRGDDLDLADLAGAVRQTVVREFGVSPRRVLLLRPGAVRRTTSGKIERATMRALYLDGSLGEPAVPA